MFISHDINIVQHISDNIAVMFLGEIIEYGSYEQVMLKPLHPYTEHLISLIPMNNVSDRIEERKSEKVNNRYKSNSRCCFCEICKRAFDKCFEEIPTCVSFESGHMVKCHLFKN